MDEKGITLLEVILTTIILGLLASVATFSVSHYMMYGKKKIVEGDLATIATAVKLYVLDHNQQLPSDPKNDLTPYIPEWPVDPFSIVNPPAGYTIELRKDSTNTQKVYIGSCGPDGMTDYGAENESDDIYRYVK